MPYGMSRSSAAASGICIVIALLWLGAGCSTAYVAQRRMPINPLTSALRLTSKEGPQPTSRTVQLLRRYDLEKDVRKQPEVVLARLQTKIVEQPTPDEVYALAELAYVNGVRQVREGKPQGALDQFASAAIQSFVYLFDPAYDGCRNPYDPQFRRACDVYNASLEAGLRIVQKQGKLQLGAVHTLQVNGKPVELEIVLRGPWHVEDIDRLEFASDFNVTGLTNRHITYGLGVPLIAIRRKHAGEDPAERYYPPGLSFAVTALLRLEDVRSAKEGARRCVLELYDAADSSDVSICNRLVPLQTDLSTPLAYFLSNPNLDQTKIASNGLFRPDAAAAFRGLYMLEPYDPKRIPVLMVHGLFSSPMTWMEMFNDLRSYPELRKNYQFWFYLYPSGQPFWVSGADLRRDLAEVQQTLDPTGENLSLQQMILVGHSMGGLVSKLQTIESGDAFWKLLSDQPFENLKASPEDKAELERMLFIHPNPAIRRVITIGTPHRGSDFANDTTRWLGRKLISLPEMMLRSRAQVLRDNPGFFRDPSLLAINTSIDSLAPGSPVFPALLAAPLGPGVQFHNIVGVVPKGQVLERFSEKGDGIVPLESARIEGIASELVVAADHVTVHQHPDSTREVRRILREHARQMIAARSPHGGANGSSYGLPVRRETGLGSESQPVGHAVDVFADDFAEPARVPAKVPPRVPAGR